MFSRSEWICGYSALTVNHYYLQENHGIFEVGTLGGRMLSAHIQASAYYYAGTEKQCLVM